MRQQSKWDGKVKTDLVVKEYPMRLQWGYHMVWGDPVFIDVSPFAAMTGVYDGWIKQSAKKLRLGPMQYDEIAIVREKIAKNINRYDSRKGCIETFLFRLVFWAARDVRAKCHRSQVDFPFRIFERKREFRQPIDVRIDKLNDAVADDGPAAARAFAELEEIRVSFGEQARPDEIVERKQEMEATAMAVKKALRKIPTRERQILRWRMWWLKGEKRQRGDKTLDQVADKLGISKERVNQLQKRAVNLLRFHLEPFWAEYRGTL